MYVQEQLAGGQNYIKTKPHKKQSPLQRTLGVKTAGALDYSQERREGGANQQRHHQAGYKLFTITISDRLQMVLSTWGSSAVSTLLEMLQRKKYDMAEFLCNKYLCTKRAQEKSKYKIQFKH
jgi:hypothetical protein